MTASPSGYIETISENAVVGSDYQRAAGVLRHAIDAIVCDYENVIGSIRD